MLFEMGSDAMIYTTSLIKNGSGIQKLRWGKGYTAHRQQGDLISILSFYQNKESRLKLSKWLNHSSIF
jgi:hypothetical protein